MRCRKHYNALTFLFLAHALSAASMNNMTWRVLSSSENEITLHIENTSDAIQGRILLNPLRLIVQSSDPELSIRVSGEKWLAEAGIPEDSVYMDVPLSPSERSRNRRPEFEKQKISGYWELRTLGRTDDLYISQLNITGCQLQSGRVRIAREAIIQITGAGLKLIQDTAAQHDIVSGIALKRAVSRFSRNIPENKIQERPAHGDRRLKIVTREQGIYRITYPMMVNAGWDPGMMNPRSFRIVGEIGEIPVRITGGEDGRFDFYDVIEFWGDRFRNRDDNAGVRLDPYSATNIYWLETGSGDGLRMARVTGTPSENAYPANHFPYTLHIEEDNYFSRLPGILEADEADHWFFSKPIIGDKKEVFEFTPKSPDRFAGLPVVLRARFHGYSDPNLTNPVEFFINKQRVAVSSWTGNEIKTITSEEFSPTFLIDGTNELTVVNGSDQGPFATLLIDWFEIEYPKNYTADEYAIDFFAPKYSTGRFNQFEIEGFAQKDIDIYKRNGGFFQGQRVESVTDTLGNTTYTVFFEDRVVDESTEYLAVTSAGKLLPDTLILSEYTDLMAPGLGADYIVITPSDTLGEDILQPLIDLRESQGLKSRIVYLDEVYENFNFGIPHPKGIRDFLSYAYHHWNPGPRFILLVGDGYIDHRDKENPGSLIPAPHYQTYGFGAAASDHWYALLAGDDALPDVAVGRIPVQNRRDLEDVVDKIINYETQSRGEWRNRVLYIGAEDENDVFRIQSEYMIRQALPHSIHPERLFLSGSFADPYLGGTEDLLRQMQEGVSILTFRGHGGGGIWADAGLLDLDDVDLIENTARLPVIFSMTCFTCDFASGVRNLGEALLLQPRSGAIAMWGATGTGWVQNDYYMLLEMHRILSETPSLRLGELLRQTKIAYGMTNFGSIALSELYQQSLLGDPALKLAFPENESPVVLDQQAVAVQDTIHIHGTADTGRFSMKLELVQKDYAEFDAEFYSFNQSDWNIALPVPDYFLDDAGGIRVHMWNYETDYQARGYAAFSYASPFFDSLKTIPANPTFRDSVRISARVEAFRELKSVRCCLISPRKDTLEMFFSDQFQSYVTAQYLGPFVSGGVSIIFSVMAEHEDGTVQESPAVSIQIPTLPDIAYQSVGLSGTDRVCVEAFFQNLGEETVEEAVILFDFPECGTVKTDTIRLDTFGSAIASVTAPAVQGEIYVRIQADPDSVIIEKNKNNNFGEDRIPVSLFNVSPENGTYLNTGLNDTVGVAGLCHCMIAPGSISEEGVLEIGIPNVMPESVLRYSGEPAGTVIRVAMNDPESSPLNHPALLVFRTDMSDNAASRKPYIWNRDLKRWAVCQYETGDTAVLCQTRDLGLFLIADFNDNIPPTIELHADNHLMTPGSYVSGDGTMTALLQDKSGIDLRPGKVQLFIDQQQIPESALILPDSTDDPRSVALTYRLQQTAGNHTIRLVAYDVHGNQAVFPEMMYQVSNHLQIRYLGNYPNPFRLDTRFVYVLTDLAYEVSLKIYTTSGKLIRVFDGPDMTGADYHEVLWEGDDEWGDKVANGVYFFKLTAKNHENTDEITGKIAKIR